MTPIFENQQITHFVAIKEDITKRKRYEEELYIQANFDALTQLPNRNMLVGQLQDIIADKKQNGGKSVLMLLDLDDFKTVNDSLGHSVGDCLLRVVAERLKACISKEDQIFRLGGDEFAIIPENIHDEQQLEALAVSLMQIFTKPFALPGQEIFITASMGIALSSEDGLGMEDLLRNADTAMYSSKNKGRNTFERYSVELNIQLQEKQQLTNMLRRALDNNEFLLYYQPQQELTTDQIIGFEALLRWQPQEGPMIFPDKFIPILEETGMIVPVGEWVLKEVCQQVKRWQKQDQLQACFS